MMLLTKKEAQILGENVLEAIDAKVAPIIEKIETLKDQVSQADLENFRESLKADFQAVDSDITNTIGTLATLKDDIDKKFHIAAKIIVPIIHILRKQSGANVCDKDIKGLALLLGESMPQTEGLNKDQLNELFEKTWKET
jgi:hypothetical protein